MANSYKNIVITPNTGSTTGDPTIVFSGGDTNTNTDITLRVYPTSNGTLSFEGNAGQLFSITNDLTGSLFSVNDVSGIPLIEVNVTSQQITFGEFYGNVGIGKAASTSSIYKLDVNGTVNASNYLINTFPVAALSYANGVANSANLYGMVYANGVANAANSNAATKVASVTGTAGRITSSGGTTPTIDLATAGAGAATYSSGISSVTVDAYGRVTSVTGSAGYVTSSGVTSVATGTGLTGGTITSTGTLSVDFATVATVANATAAFAFANGVASNTTAAFAAANSKVASVSGTSGRITSSGGTTPAIDLATTTVSATTYGGTTQIPSFTVDAYGRLTFAGNNAFTSGGVTIGNEASSATTFYPVFTTTTSGSMSSANVDTADLTYVPSTGTLSAKVFNSLSDITLKTDIEGFDGVMLLDDINPVSFRWKNNSMKSYGVIAQELEKAFPDLVQTNEQGIKSVSYMPLIGILLDVVKKQQKDIEEIKKLLNRKK